jgi:hypothetical protein
MMNGKSFRTKSFFSDVSLLNQNALPQFANFPTMSKIKINPAKMSNKSIRKFVRYILVSRQLVVTISSIPNLAVLY